MKDPLVKYSKFLSLVLRHKPEVIGLSLDDQGWVRVDTLLKACSDNGKDIDREMLEEIVSTNNKKRFAFNDSNTKIRASQGHSLEINLGLTPVKPPDSLFHGTAWKTADLIWKSGLKKMNRQHVHLSKDMKTATSVGSRHGKPMVFIVDALGMHNDGYKFYLSENGVWLTDSVPKKYLWTA